MRLYLILSHYLILLTLAYSPGTQKRLGSTTVLAVSFKTSAQLSPSVGQPMTLIRLETDVAPHQFLTRSAFLALRVDMIALNAAHIFVNVNLIVPAKLNELLKRPPN